MTDAINDPAAAGMAFDPAFVDTKVFEKKGIWLPQLAVHKFNAGAKILDGFTFRDCLIEGPGVLAVVDGCHFEGCNMGQARDPRSLLLKAVGPMISGVVPFSNSQFINCRFFMIGFTGGEATMKEFETMLVSARAQEQAAAAANGNAAS